MNDRRPKSPESGYLFNSLFKFAVKKHPEPRVTAPLCGESTGDRWVPHTKGPVTRKMFPRHNVFMYHASRVEWHAAIASEQACYVVGRESRVVVTSQAALPVFIMD